ncbi:hypothetical protein GOP47_0026904 [Adiantum capillus-veneris]|nr:hypothetical protein GOP47_0026904 [Adiantum capillus-veneris]
MSARNLLKGSFYLRKGEPSVPLVRECNGHKQSDEHCEWKCIRLRDRERIRHQRRRKTLLRRPHSLWREWSTYDCTNLYNALDLPTMSMTMRRVESENAKG